MLSAAAQLIAVCSCTPQVSPERRDHLLVKQPEQQRVVCEWSLSFGSWCCFVYFFLFSSVASSREESNYQTFGETRLMNQRKLSWVNIKLLYASCPETHLPMNDNGAPVLLDHQLLFSPSFIIIILYFRKGRREWERERHAANGLVWNQTEAAVASAHDRLYQGSSSSETSMWTQRKFPRAADGF